MITRRHLYLAHKRRDLPLSRHERASANILSRVSKELDKYPLPYKLDYNWPFHLIVYVNNRTLSVYSGGFNNLIEICPLTKDGNPYANRYEKGYLTPEGAVNYILRKYGKPKNVQTTE